MSIKTQEYVGELIRKEIKKRFLTNGSLIYALQQAGIEISAPKFSNKIYGIREQFTEKELEIINKTLGTDFKYRNLIFIPREIKN